MKLELENKLVTAGSSFHTRAVFFHSNRPGAILNSQEGQLCLPPVGT